MSAKFKMRKVFDCQDMPEDVREEFFGSYDTPGNDCYISWTPGENIGDLPLVDQWLIDSGAEMGEEVIVKHWW